MIPFPKRDEEIPGEADEKTQTSDGGGFEPLNIDQLRQNTTADYIVEVINDAIGDVALIGSLARKHDIEQLVGHPLNGDQFVLLMNAVNSAITAGNQAILPSVVRDLYGVMLEIEKGGN